MGQFSGKWPSSLDNVSKPLITVIAAIVTRRPKNSMVLWRSNELQISLFECWIARSERLERIPRVALNDSLNKSRSFCPFLLIRRGYEVASSAPLALGQRVCAGIEYCRVAARHFFYFLCHKNCEFVALPLKRLSSLQFATTNRSREGRKSVLPSQQDGLLLVSPLKLKNPVHLLKSGQNPTE